MKLAILTIRPLHGSWYLPRTPSPFLPSVPLVVLGSYAPCRENSLTALSSLTGFLLTSSITKTGPVDSCNSAGHTSSVTWRHSPLSPLIPHRNPSHDLCVNASALSSVSGMLTNTHRYLVSVSLLWHNHFFWRCVPFWSKISTHLLWQSPDSAANSWKTCPHETRPRKNGEWGVGQPLYVHLPRRGWIDQQSRWTSASSRSSVQENKLLHPQRQRTVPSCTVTHCLANLSYPTPKSPRILPSYHPCSPQ